MTSSTFSNDDNNNTRTATTTTTGFSNNKDFSSLVNNTGAETKVTVTRHQQHDQPFFRYDGVVIVTKIHGKHQLPLLYQSLCLFHTAYNARMKYDIVVFTTLNVEESDLRNIRRLVSPVNLTVVVDNPGLQQMIDDLSLTRREKFYQRCGSQTNPKDFDPNQITWKSECPGRISYNWQAEFRSRHIYKQPILKKYQYMLWLDSDAFCTQQWEQDPVHTLIQNNLVVLYDHFPRGRAKDIRIQYRILKSYNTTICRIQLSSEDGQFITKLEPTDSPDQCLKENFPLIHGFFHVTNLEFYRNQMKWYENFIGDCFLCRIFDDQIAITVPAAILASDKSWDMYSHNLRLGVYHNNYIDGQDEESRSGNSIAKMGGFLQFWNAVHAYGNATANPPFNDKDAAAATGNIKASVGASNDKTIDPEFRKRVVANQCPITAGG